VFVSFHDLLRNKTLKVFLANKLRNQQAGFASQGTDQANKPLGSQAMGENLNAPAFGGRFTFE
jgi:hypothetical protein